MSVFIAEEELKRPSLYLWSKPLRQAHHVLWRTPVKSFFSLQLTLYSITRHILLRTLPDLVCFGPRCLAILPAMWRPSHFQVHHLKHLVSVLTLFCLIGTFSFARGGIFTEDQSGVNPIERYGMLWGCLLYIMQMTIFIPIPFMVLNFLGVVLLNVFIPRPKLQRSPLLGPFLCFRVVTRGLYPNLVRENVHHNLHVCESVGLHSFMFEVVTDSPIHLQQTSRSREVVVPANYRTRSGTLFKARALQYALEPEVDILSSGDYIVHLDEETLLTEEAVIGIINFAGSGEYSFGQGVIKYGKGKVVNWITTLADSVRVGIDYGCIRFSLGVLHKPVFSWKGSFIVADAEAEKSITFDHGPEASIAEDCFFACVAFSKGYNFDFVEGEMLESSTFTLFDFVQQRKRWMHGIFLTAISKKIPLRYKAGPVLMSVAGMTMPANVLMLPVNIVWPMPSNPALNLAYCFLLGTFVYLFILGTLQTFCYRKYGLIKCLGLVFATLLCALVACVLENISSVLVFWMPRVSRTGFYVVKKDTQIRDIKIV
ncbi:beta-1,4-mannosyltransferase bre-3 [Elysia marginata]|uniref:Beta-1,4-mannosyltransferase bre-3 n=1 Tax=Elysia marginata TaxID=1093978 RepID=A0AAV4JEW3_9GAST|nr:beta-1,4-mannosyltransferase bre-3 [Elysia marginata]